MAHDSFADGTLEALFKFAFAGLVQRVRKQVDGAARQRYGRERMILDERTGRVENLSPQASATLPPPFFHHAGSKQTWRKVVYVLALAGDAPTSAQMSYAVAQVLRDPQNALADQDDLYALDRPVNYEAVAEPTWTVAMYQQQCSGDPSTAGASVLLPPSTRSSSWNVFLSASWTTVGLQAMILDCEPVNRAYLSNKSKITWSPTSRLVRAEGTVVVVYGAGCGRRLPGSQPRFGRT